MRTPSANLKDEKPDLTVPAAALLDDPAIVHSENTNPHIAAVVKELNWLSKFIQFRLNSYFSDATDVKTAVETPAVPKPDSNSVYGKMVKNAKLSTDARLVLALTIAPHLLPSVLDPFFLTNPGIGKVFSEFGGQMPNGQGTFLPTGETAIFLLSGTDPSARLNNLHLFETSHSLYSDFSVSLAQPQADMPMFSGALQMSRFQLKFLITGEKEKPHYSMNFPAHRLTTKLNWDDLVLAPEVLDQINHIHSWIEHEEQIMSGWELDRLLAPGYRALFYGPSGTGKTLTVSLLGQRTGLDVYRVDLSMMISKFIGETEKNLANIFDQAAHKNWILFFDEADALFGKRTSTNSSNDKYANQEVAYLLQRIETCPSVVILATNLRSNIDDAFYRRFQSLVGFTKPNRVQRLSLWKNSLNRGVTPLDEDVDLEEIAKQYELVGGTIVNIVRHAAINALRGKRKNISQSDLLAGIANEVHKEGRIS